VPTVPLGMLVVLTVIVVEGAGAVPTASENVELALCAALSLTLKVTLAVIADVGVPEMVLPLSVSPAGSVPPVSVQV
jgi:hypothetical protein